MTRPQLLGRNRFGSAFWLMGGDASHIFVERASDRQWECISRWTQIAPLTAALNTCVNVQRSPAAAPAPLAPCNHWRFRRAAALTCA